MTTQPQGDHELEEQFFVPNPVRWQYWVPALRLFRAFRMAIDYRRMILAVLGVILWAAGLIFLYQLVPQSLQEVHRPMGSLSPAMYPTHWPWQEDKILQSPAFEPEVFLHAPIRSLQTAFSNGNLLLWPLQKTFISAREVAFPSDNFTHWLRSVAATLWSLLVCGIFGGAIARMAAVDFAGHGELSCRRAMGFSLRHSVSYLGAPLIPLFGLLACWIPNFIAGVIARIPYLGDTAVGVFWFLPLIFGTLITLIIVGVGAGWPLMIAAISSEASDAFDGLSRAYSYLFNQLWYFLLLLVVMLVTGSASLYLVNGFLGLTWQFTTMSTQLTGLQESEGPYAGSGKFESDVALLDGRPPQDAPTVIEPIQSQQLANQSSTLQMEEPPAPAPIPSEATLKVSPPAAHAMTFWTNIFMTIPVAFVFSYFWTTVTLIYFMLRLRDDATPLTEVGGLQPLKNGASLPLAGIPAAELREKQRNADLGESI